MVHSHSNAFPAIAFVLLWNSGFIAAALALPHAPTFTLLSWRYLALTLILGCALACSGRFPRAGWWKAGHAMRIGILSHGVWLACAMLALDRGVPAGIVALVVALQPLATGALSGRVTGEKTPAIRWAGLVLGFLGVCVVLIGRIEFSDAGSVFGYLIPLVSVAAITLASLAQRRVELYDRDRLLPADQNLFYQSLGTLLVVLPVAIIFERLSTQWTPSLAISLAWLVLGVSLGAYALMWKLIALMDATRVASLFYFGPPVTMIMAWFAFGDTLRPADLAGLCIVLAGVWLTYARQSDA